VTHGLYLLWWVQEKEVPPDGRASHTRRPGALIAVVMLLAFLMGLAAPLRAAAIQHVSADASRARAASLASACDMACMLIVVPLAAAMRA
jgi:hypothetical protein